MDIAAYISDRYYTEYGQQIDEMKLHKLMYFTQREALVQTNEPLFDATFYGWKYGPALKEVRNAFKYGIGMVNGCTKICRDAVSIINIIFEKYAAKDSWSLSRLTHGEVAWQNSRIGVSEENNSDNPMSLEDIRKDAERIKQRRSMLSELGLA